MKVSSSLQESVCAVPAAPSSLWKAPCGMARAYQQAQPQHAYQQAQPQQPGVSAAQQSGRVGCWEPGSGWTHMVQPTFDTPWGSAPPPLQGGPPTHHPTSHHRHFQRVWGSAASRFFLMGGPPIHTPDLDSQFISMPQQSPDLDSQSDAAGAAVTRKNPGRIPEPR